MRLAYYTFMLLLCNRVI